MNNDLLVDLIEEHDPFSRFKSPRDRRILEVMRRVDRAQFLDTDPTILTIVDTDFANKLLKFLIDWEKISKTEEKAVDYLLYGAATLLRSRKDYRVETRSLAYNDHPVPIGYDQTCSQPSLVAFMTDLLELQEGIRVFELGLGCGYTAAITLHCLGESGYLVTSETKPQLAGMGEQNLRVHFGEGIENRLKIIRGDGFKAVKEEAPFDRIYFTAAIDSDSFNIDTLVDSLRGGCGIVLIPDKTNNLTWVKYEAGRIADKKIYENAVNFVNAQNQPKTK